MKFLPVMRRARILTDELDQSFADIIDKTPGFQGIILSYWVDGEQALNCLSPDGVWKNGATHERILWRDLRERGAASPALALLYVEIMSSAQMHSRIEAVVSELPVGMGNHFIDLLITPSCLILCHSDLSALVCDNHHYFAAEPEKETTIAPFCTMLLKPPQSAHSQIEEPQSIAGDLKTFQHLAARSLSLLADTHGLWLGNPDIKDLQSAATLDLY